MLFSASVLCATQSSDETKFFFSSFLFLFFSSFNSVQPPSQYSRASFEVAQIIVEACVTNERWRIFVSERLPKINDLQKDTPLGGEDAERSSSLASPRVVSFNSADEISHLDLGLSKNSAHGGGGGDGGDGEDEEEDDGFGGVEHVLMFGRNDPTRDDDDDDSDEEDSDEEEPDNDPVRLAELQARYGFDASKVGGGESGGGGTEAGDGDDDWGFATGAATNEGNDGDVNFGDDGWGAFDDDSEVQDQSVAAAGDSNVDDDDDDVPPAPQTTSVTPILPPTSK